MPASDPTEILLAHDRWATGQIIDASMTINDEQFHREFEMGVGSLHNSINHILGAMQGWGDLLAGREQRKRLEEDQRSPAEMRDLLRVLADDLAASFRNHPDLAEECVGERGGQKYSFTRGAILTHVTTHSMHHRAQCLNMLRHLGIEELPPSSVMQWYMMGSPSS